MAKEEKINIDKFVGDPDAVVFIGKIGEIEVVRPKQEK